MKSRRSKGLELVARDIRPDSRNRVSLGPALKDLEDVTFKVYRDDRGRILLEPQVSIPAAEAWLFQNEKALQSVRRGLKDVAEGKTTRLGSFGRFAVDDE